MNQICGASSAGPILIRNIRVFSLDGDIHRPPEKDVLISDGRIKAILPPGAPAAEPPADGQNWTIIDGTGKLVIPGLVNAHYHS